MSTHTANIDTLSLRSLRAAEENLAAQYQRRSTHPVNRWIGERLDAIRARITALTSPHDGGK